MAMPRDLVLVRHGQSEANIVQKAEEESRTIEVPELFYERHDWAYRLTPNGVEQAKRAGRWIVENIGEPAEVFDRAYVSPFVRARETAAHLGGPACKWLVDERLKERDWGIYGATPKEERERIFPMTERMRQQSYFYTRFDNGESIADVFMRARDLLATFHRDTSDKSVIAVTHGDTMGAFRSLIEHMLPEEWEDMDKDISQSVRNCTIIWYSRANPENHDDVRDHVSWRRIIRTDDESASPHGGEWVELAGRRKFTGTDLLETVEAFPHIFPEDTVTKPH